MVNKRAALPAIPTNYPGLHSVLQSMKVAIEQLRSEMDSMDSRATAIELLIYGFSNKYEVSQGEFKPKRADGKFQFVVNNGAHTLLPPDDNAEVVVLYTNGATAGAITTSAFDEVSGTAPGTTVAHNFFAYITKCYGRSHLEWVTLQ